MEKKEPRLPVRSFPPGNLAPENPKKLAEAIDAYIGIPGNPFEVKRAAAHGGFRYYDLISGNRAFSIGVPNGRRRGIIWYEKPVAGKYPYRFRYGEAAGSYEDFPMAA